MVSIARACRHRRAAEIYQGGARNEMAGPATAARSMSAGAVAFHVIWPPAAARGAPHDWNAIMRVLLSAAFAALFATGAVAQVTVITHATLIDGSGAPPRPDVAIVMENGRIRDIGAGLTVPAGAAVVDATGRFVVPGIINAHGHVGPAPRDPQLRQYALYGVTTTTSMSFDADDIAEFKARQRAGDLRGARILTVKYRFMSPPFIPGSENKTPAEARAKVDEIVAHGADFVKVWIDAGNGRYPKLDRAFCAAVMDEARKFGKITMAHIVTYDDAKMIVDEGVNILAHNVRDAVIDDDFVAKLKAKNVTVISTLAREEAMFVFADAPAFIDTPFFQKGLSAERLALLRTKKRDEQRADPQQAAYRRAFEIDKINLKKLSEGGVRIALGTDSGGDLNRFFIQGFFEHHQMELMRDAGLSPMQIVEAFSRNAAEALGIDRDFGTLAPGKAADLLVVAKNPLDDIANMRLIDAVYLGGKKFE
jgi:imidazolonepropionase-like amidohydrolase